MKIYDKITWKIKNDDINLKYILGKEKLRLINNGIQYAKANNYDIGIEKLNIENLTDFYENIYKVHMSQKENPRIRNLIELYEERIKIGESIYLGYVRNKGQLVAGGIFLDKFRESEGKIAMIGFRAYTEGKIEHLFLGYYIEYLLYKRALDINCDWISRGLDGNIYGYLGLSIGLAIHKLQYKFLPYLSPKSIEIEFDENSIKKETLIFVKPSPENNFKKAILWTDKNIEEIEKEFGIIKKRGIEIEIRKLK